MMDVDEESKYDSPVYMLSSLQKKTPQIIKACVKLLKVKTKSDRSKTAILALLSTICNAPGGLGEPKAVNAVMGAMDITLSPSASKAIKLDSLLFLQSALKCEKGGHLPSTVQPHVLTILPLVQSAAAEDWYKIIAEAIRVFSLVPALITARDSKDSMSDSPPVDTDTTQKAADIIFASVEPRLKENDIDQEIKETSIVAMGELVTTLGNLLSSDQISTVLSLLLERLGNEITRTAALKTLGKIASSPLKIDISSILSEATEQLAHFLRQNSRSLKLCVLETISSLVQSNNNKMAPSLFDLILTEAAPLITDADLQISHLAVNVSYDVLVSSKDSFKAIKSTTLPPLIVLASSPLLQGLALNSTTKFLEELSIAGSSEVTFSEISAALYAAVDTETRQQAMSNLSKCIAAICAVADSNLQEEVLKDLVVDVNGADKLKRRLGLLTIGALGERVDLSSVPKLGDILLAAFSNEDDQTKAAAAFALGHVSVRAIDVFLPVILDALNNGTSIYLVLSSLKELIVCAISNGLEVESKYVDQIMPHLVTFCEDEAEGVRSMAAECMGCFITMKPKQVLPVLKSLGESKMDGSEKSNLVLWTVATSVRNALGSKNVDLAALTEHMSGFLEYLKSEDFAVRTATLLMVNAAVWYQNTVITAQMEDVVLPALLTLLELKVIRTIDLGPFKHKVDDALPLRKACISIIDSALTRCPGVLPVASILPKLASCLTDESDVVLSCHQLIIKFTKLHPALVAQNVPLFLSSGLEKTINKKIKDGASANDREKAEELIKSAMRVAAEWQRIDDVHGSATFGEFVERIKAKDNLELIWNEVLRNR
jgi:cullin-associated NEDD8-dissociated protein 1